MPSAKRLRAQLAFKDSMVRGILQFTPSIAFCYVLHRCESRDIRCRESFWFVDFWRSVPTRTVSGNAGAILPDFVFLDAFCAGFGCESPRSPEPSASSASRESPEGAKGFTPPAPPRRGLTTVRGSFCLAGFDNDPSAGSPTETLLRLLLPLNDKVQWTSRDVAGGEPLTSPPSEHFTGPFNR